MKDCVHKKAISTSISLIQNLINPLGPRPAATSSLWNPIRREVAVSNDPGIQL